MLQPILLLALAGLAAVPAPQDPAPGPQPAQEPEKDGYGGIVGTMDARWMARSESKKVLFESGGKPLLDAWQGSWIWLAGQTPAEDALMPAEDGRAVAVTSICALSMSGNGTGIRSGAYFRQYRVLTRALRALQDAETGAYVAADAPERALDQALAVHCIAEATISHPVEAMFEHNRKGVAALLALRGEDGLWHVGGKDEAPVDAFTTGVAAYALYTAVDAGAEVEAEVFEPIAEWSAKAEITGADEGERATHAIAILGARVFASGGLGRGLKEDARTAELLGRIDAWLPTSAAADKPAATGPVEREDFAYLASVVLYQADNLRWNRLYTWIKERAVAGVPAEVSENKGYAAGDNGRLPQGAAATTALRALQMQSSFREPALDVFAN